MRYLTPRLAVACVNVLVAGVALAACGSEGGDAGAAPTTSVSPSTQSRLIVTVKPSPESQARNWTLTCDPPGGDHPFAGKACEALTRHPDLLKPLPPEQACTQIYGGPQVATVTGTWQGRPVNVKFSGQNGCEINRWQKAAPLLDTPEASPTS